jgi:hypothetical protein
MAGHDPESWAVSGPYVDGSFEGGLWGGLEPVTDGERIVDLTDGSMPMVGRSPYDHIHGGALPLIAVEFAMTGVVLDSGSDALRVQGDQS